MQQKMLQMKPDELLRSEGGGEAFLHMCQVGIVQPAGEAVPRLYDDLRQQVSLQFVHPEDLLLEEAHHMAGRGKGYDDQIRRRRTRCLHGMKFVGLVEDNVPFLENVGIPAGGDADLALIYIQEFPEVVGFPLEREITHVFKIVYAIKLFNMNGIFEIHTDITHINSPLLKDVYENVPNQEVCFCAPLTIY